MCFVDIYIQIWNWMEDLQDKKPSQMSAVPKGVRIDERNRAQAT